jgi:hypothetical protein
MNIQHSSRSDEWYTPKWVMDLVHKVIGYPTFDPASSLEANEVVKATHFFTDRSLEKPWLPGSIYLNPPGGKVKNKSQSRLFWEKLMSHHETGLMTDAIFMAFSAEALQYTQASPKAITDFTFCVPDKRIRFIHPDGRSESPSHANVIVYVPGTVDATDSFIQTFQDVGGMCRPAKRRFT